MTTVIEICQFFAAHYFDGASNAFKSGVVRFFMESVLSFYGMIVCNYLI